PIREQNSIVSLGEGFTPIMVREISGTKVVYKLDFLNPTGSFKDRGASVLISHLNEIGIKEIVEDSSGNAGAAIAAYSKAAGIKCRVFVPAEAPFGKVLQIIVYGAEIIRVPGSRENVNKAALEAAQKSYYAGHLWNPFFIEGLKTISFEVYEQTRGVPDAAILPVGSGGLLLGVHKGFKELREMRLAEKIPRIFGVQTYGFAQAYERLHNKKVKKAEEAILADGIAVPNPPRIDQIVRAVKETGGDIILVSNEEIIEGFKDLASLGLFVEPTSATAQAALNKLIKEKVFERGSTIFVPLTGIGLKATDKIGKYILK
ncbi:MAG: threonine synthase, partial [Thermoprotei archaeon]